MDDPVYIVGIGQMGGVFARGFLRLGRPVVPIVRGVSPGSLLGRPDHPELVLVAVAEGDLHPVLAGLPAPWRDRAGLLQNELLPRDWEAHRISDPTVAVVWFEKKAGRPITEIVPTPVFGPAAGLVADALATLGLATARPPRERLVFELVRKNLYILTANIAGLDTGGAVGELWERHRTLAAAVAADVLAVQSRLAGVPLPEDELLAALGADFAADPGHGATGRSAPVRLRRALDLAASHGVETPALAAIAARHPG